MGSSLGFCGLCPQPLNTGPGQGAPLITCLLPHPARACGHTQGEPRLREREIAGPQNIMEENQALPLGAWLFLIRWGQEQNEPQDPRWRHLGVEGGGRSPRVGRERPGAGASSPSWTLAPRNPELWSLRPGLALGVQTSEAASQVTDNLYHFLLPLYHNLNQS